MVLHASDNNRGTIPLGEHVVVVVGSHDADLRAQPEGVLGGGPGLDPAFDSGARIALRPASAIPRMNAAHCVPFRPSTVSVSGTAEATTST